MALAIMAVTLVLFALFLRSALAPVYLLAASILAVFATIPNAVAVAAPAASRAITTAGVALAASFAMLAVIPLGQFRQIAITMAIGVLIDAIAVRSLLVPALVVLFGRLGMWPRSVITPRTPGQVRSAARVIGPSRDRGYFPTV